MSSPYLTTLRWLSLHSPPSPQQWLEMLIVVSTADYFRYIFSTMKQLVAICESKGGRIRPESIPSTFLGRIVTPVHGLAILIPPLVYMTTLTLNGFQPPKWLDKLALPDGILDDTQKNALRVLACLASFSLRSFTDKIFEHLGEQWHYIGRREKPRVVKTGPYAWVRHPAYSSVLIQQALWAVMFWSYTPLVALGIIAAAFAIKMPIEESLIQKDDGVRDEYRKYMKEVPARIIPFIW